MKKGMFVVIDGNDGSGKATQASMLFERLKRDTVSAEKIDFPQYDTNFFGRLVGECLAGVHGDFARLDPKLASLPYALDRFEASPRIRAWLSEGKVVIADRFTSANQIHQAGKVSDAGERADFLSWLDDMEHGVLGVPRPDAVIYLRVPVELSLALLGKKRAAKNSALGSETQDVVEKDRQYLTQSVESAQSLAAAGGAWHQIDCAPEGSMRSPEDIHEEVYALVRSLV
jgi:dTMP kinase